MECVDLLALDRGPEYDVDGLQCPDVRLPARPTREKFRGERGVSESTVPCCHDIVPRFRIPIQLRLSDRNGDTSKSPGGVRFSAVFGIAPVYLLLWVGWLSFVLSMAWVGAAPTAPLTQPSERREQAVFILRQALEEGPEWTKVRAAEALLWNGYYAGVKEALEEELAIAGPFYRIGLWRALAKAQGNNQAAAKRYIGKIRQAFLDVQGADRVHAVEALAKLGYSERPAELLRVAREDKGSFRAFARWALANSGDADDEVALAELLDSSDGRATVSYALRNLKKIQPASLARLEQIAFSLSSEDRSRVYALGAFFVHSSGERRSKARQELLKYLTTGNTAQKFEVCGALGTAGDRLDEDVLDALLRSEDIDVRVGAAHALLRIERRQHRGLSWLDWTVMLFYGTAVLGVGWFLSRKMESTEEFFVGGRQMNSFAIGISLFATLLSTVSYLAHPGEMIKHGPVVLASVAMIPLIYVIVGYGLIPYLVRLPITSAYEILEGRLGTRIRLLGSFIFIVTRLVWMALMIYLTGRVMVVVLGWPLETLPYIVIVAGFVTVIYTALGGLRAVVITDVTQFFILFGGAVLTIVMINRELGSFNAWFPTSWAPNWDVQPFFSLDPAVRATVVGAFLNSLIYWICTAGSDQLAIQRYLATRDATAARRAFLVNSVAGISITVVLALVGFALLGFFSVNPHLIPDGQSLIEDADYIFPHYVANYLPIGLAGLVIVAMFAAVMSSLDSGINSVSTVIMVDFLNRSKRDTEKYHLATARYLTVGIGVAVVLISSVIGKVPGNIQEVAVKTNYLFLVPLFILFFLALFVSFATPFGAAFGAIYSFLAGALIAFWDVLTGQPGVSFQWIAVVSLLAGLIFGPLLSMLPTREKGWKTNLMWGSLSLLPWLLISYLVVGH